MKYWMKGGIAGFVCLTGLLAACSQPPGGKAAEEIRTVKAVVESLKEVPLPVFAVLPGMVVSADRVEVSSRLSGYIYDLDVHAGQHVSEGQLLFSVDPTGVKERIRQATAELAKAEAALTEARDNFERYQNLYKEKSTTLAAFQQAERGFKVARGDAQAAQAGLRSARAELKYAEVKAPFDGLVVAKTADNGQLASPGTVVLTLENTQHMQVKVQVDDSAYAHLSLGQTVQVEVADQGTQMNTVNGRVERMVDAADPVTHTHLVKIGLPLTGEDWSGRFTLVRIQVGEQDGIVIPESAIHRRAGITGVFVVDARKRAQFRMVTIGKQRSQGRNILSGLSPGDRIILSAEGELTNGIPIQTSSENHS